MVLRKKVGSGSTHVVMMQWSSHIENGTFSFSARCFSKLHLMLSLLLDESLMEAKVLQWNDLPFQHRKTKSEQSRCLKITKKIVKLGLHFKLHNAELLSIWRYFSLYRECSTLIHFTRVLYTRWRFDKNRETLFTFKLHTAELLSFWRVSERRHLAVLSTLYRQCSTLIHFITILYTRWRFFTWNFIYSRTPFTLTSFFAKNLEILKDAI